MGNCQATDVVATAIIQHPNGRHERLYWPTTAGEVMRSHPGHYVALVTFHFSGDALNTSSTTEVAAAAAAPGGSLRLIRVRLLRHKDLLLIGQVYRLVTSQEVVKAQQARKQEKHMKAQAELMKQQEQQQQQQMQRQHIVVEGRGQTAKNEREKQKNSHQWRPSLQSIPEAGI